MSKTIEYRGTVVALSTTDVSTLLSNIISWHTADPDHQVTAFRVNLEDGSVTVQAEVRNVARANVPTALDTLESQVTNNTSLPWSETNWTVA